MVSEIDYREQYPYYAVTLLIVTFPNGEMLTGTGAVVGVNDILTATHVIYSADRGGWATKVEVHVGADFNSVTNRFDHESLLDLGTYGYQLDGWPQQVYAEAPLGMLSDAESQYDIAVIGLSKPIGNMLGGWFGLAAGYDEPTWAWHLGYPFNGTGMMQGQALVELGTQYQIYEANSSDGSDIMGPGSSGGPLYVYGEDEKPYIIGVKSGSGQGYSLWADVGFLYDDILKMMDDNDHLLEGYQPEPVTGYAKVFHNTAGNDRFEGGSELDAAVYQGLASQYDVKVGENVVEVQHLQGAGGLDTLIDVERLVFDNGVLAVDVGPWETAGSAYRLYQAAFGRTPDSSGLNYWIQEMDKGFSLASVADGFVASEEFRDLYGRDPSAEDLVRGYYVNVLGRPPEEEGFNYWVQEYRSGKLDAAELLVSFSESAENRESVGLVIDDGIWLS